MNDEDVSNDAIGADKTWLTYHEVAAKLGIDLTSAQRRALQENWSRRSSSDGKARVAVPHEVLSNVQSDGGPVALEKSSDHVAAMLALQEQLEAALTRLDGEVTELKERAEQALRDAAEARRETMAALQRVMTAELEMAKLVHEKGAADSEIMRLKREKKASERLLTQIRARGLWARLLNKS